jgi:hypothetical protein
MPFFIFPVKTAYINTLSDNVFIGEKMSSDAQNEIKLDEPKRTNPLAQWYRQPKIYVKLPSAGKFYPHGALDVSSTEEYAVYAMTAKDELMFKTPDALLSGQSTVELIKSCIPAIHDPWKMPSIDLDFCLVAIRLATYGDKMDVGANCPYCKEENDYEIDLNQWMGLYSNYHFESVIPVDPLTVHIRPYNYQEITKASIRTLEEQRIFNIVNDDNMGDEEKLERFGKSFIRLTELTVQIVSECITKIETPNGSVTDQVTIKDFIDNTSKDIFEKISKHVQGLKEKIDFKPHVKCRECEKDYDLPVTMDQANFFAVRS